MRSYQILPESAPVVSSDSVVVAQPQSSVAISQDSPQFVQPIPMRQPVYESPVYESPVYVQQQPMYVSQGPTMFTHRPRVRQAVVVQETEYDCCRTCVIL